MFGVDIALSEAIAANFIIALVGLCLWYPVFYINNKYLNIFISIIQQVFMSFIASGLWFGLIYLFLSTVLRNKPDYISYLHESIPWRLSFGLLYYFLIALLYNLIIYYQNFKDKLASETDLKALIKESELNSLKSQINPHFLFNSLNSISSLTIISPEKSREMIIKLSEFLRYSLSQKKNHITTLEEEINNLSRYLDIEKVRFGEKLKIIKNFEGDCLRKKLPWLILQPVIENAIKYGVYENLKESIVEINARCNESILQVTISNNFEEELIINKGEGIGLQNIRQRLKVIYGNKNLLKIVKKQNIFVVKLTFPQSTLLS